MKFSSTALAFLVATSLSTHEVIGQEEACVIGSFTLEFDGECSLDNALQEYSDTHYSEVALSCPHAVENDFNLILGLDKNASYDEAAGAVREICIGAWNTTHKVSYEDIAREYGDFEQTYYNGGTYWNEEVETNLESEDGSRSNHLRHDARYVRQFYNSKAQTAQVEWPDVLTNFDPDTCDINAAYCCWPQDRQANDNNGNCATAYDTNCYDKDPADNTDLCFVDLERRSMSKSEGFMLFPNDNGNGEGPIHCHGFAWSNDEYDFTSRYKANNLFYVSMYDHMHQRGYVRNIPGAPMCACAEQMPTVSRSDCTQIDVDETYLLTYNGDSLTAELTEVEIDFNSCQGKFNKNNDLWYYFLRLQDEGKVTGDQKHALNKYIVGDYNCQMAQDYEMSKLDYVRGYNHDETSWVKIAGRDSLGAPTVGRDFFKDVFAQVSNRIVRRVCATCYPSHQDIYYKRLTAVPDNMDLLHFLLNYWVNTNNVFNVDFEIYSSFEDAENGVNRWQFCSFNGNTGFPYECAPGTSRVRYQWSRFHWRNGRSDVAFYLPPPPAAINDLEGHDIGTLYIPGTAKEMDGKIYVTAYGWDIWGSADHFNFVSETRSDDVTLQVLMSKHNKVNSWAKAGLMMRQTLDSNSANVLCYSTGSKGVYMQYRQAAGQNSGYGRWSDGTNHASVWLRLEKRLNTFTCKKSTDGTTWVTVFSKTLSNWESSDFEAGLALTSHDYYRHSEAVFENYENEDYFFPSAAPTVSRSPSYLSFLSSDTTDTNVIIRNFVSERHIFANSGSFWESGCGASSGGYTDRNKWKFTPKTYGGEETYHIQNAVTTNRCLYAQPGRSWESGVGAGYCRYEDNNWVLEPTKCGEELCYFIKNARSNRRLYASVDKDGESGFGAQIDDTRDVFKWFIEVVEV